MVRIDSRNPQGEAPLILRRNRQVEVGSVQTCTGLDDDDARRGVEGDDVEAGIAGLDPGPQLVGEGGDLPGGGSGGGDLGCRASDQGRRTGGVSSNRSGFTRTGNRTRTTRSSPCSGMGTSHNASPCRTAEIRRAATARRFSRVFFISLIWPLPCRPPDRSVPSARSLIALRQKPLFHNEDNLHKELPDRPLPAGARVHRQGPGRQRRGRPVGPPPGRRRGDRGAGGVFRRQGPAPDRAPFPDGLAQRPLHRIRC